MRIARAAACLVTVLAGPACAQPAEAYVLAVQGHWVTPGRTLPLAVGAPLPAEARLVASRPGVSDRIVVVAARSGEVLLSRDCGEPRACRDPIIVPKASAASAPSWAEVLRRAMARLEGAPDRYVVTLSRQGADLPDAVLALDGSAVNLAPVLRALPAARHELLLRRLDCAPGADCAESSVTLDAAAGPAASVLMGTVGPGVYELRARATGPTLPMAVTRRCRLLLLPQEQAAAKIEQYRGWLALTERWGDTVDAGSRRSLLRALIDELATSP